MTSAERDAIVERVARALAWDALTHDEQSRRRSQAARLVDELRYDERDATSLWPFRKTTAEDPAA